MDRHLTATDRMRDTRTFVAGALAAVVGITLWGLTSVPVVSDGEASGFPASLLSGDSSQAWIRFVAMALGLIAYATGSLVWHRVAERQAWRTFVQRRPGGPAWAPLYLALVIGLPSLGLGPAFTMVFQSKWPGPIVLQAGEASYWVFWCSLLAAIGVIIQFIAALVSRWRVRPTRGNPSPPAAGGA
jgi:hypothetical protein